MKVAEEQLDYFRHILIDLEVTHVAVIRKEDGLRDIVHINTLDNKLLTYERFAVPESDLVKNEVALAKFNFKTNYLQITVNPQNNQTFYYHNKCVINPGFNFFTANITPSPLAKGITSDAWRFSRFGPPADTWFTGSRLRNIKW